MLKSSSLPLTFSKNGDISIPLQVKPGAKVNCVTEVSQDYVSIQIAAPPVDGEANLAIVKFFADLLGVKKGEIQLSGAKSKHKTLFVSASVAANLSAKEILNTIKNETGIQH